MNMRLVLNGHRRLLTAFVFSLLLLTSAGAQLLGDPEDVSRDFGRFENVYFIANRLAEFDAAKGDGTVKFDRYVRSAGLNFNKFDVSWQRAKATEFPGSEYDENPVLPFSLTFVGPRTVRLRFNSRPAPLGERDSLMLAGKLSRDSSWRYVETPDGGEYRSEFGRVKIIREPFRIEFYDANGRLLTRTQNLGDPKSFLSSTPFSFVRRSEDLARRFAATFELAHDEKIFGGGESFTRLNKRGQKLNLTVRDGMGSQGTFLYKPIPFFLSSRGYGMFTHTSAPVTLDIGHSFDAHNVIYSADDELDLFFFFGEPRDVVGAYTDVTGRATLPPLWSFGFWMSRITYKSEDEVRDVAAKLRQYQIPADVIHLDTGWFETDWRSNYEFSRSRFRDPKQMITDLKSQGFQVSLWQYTYFTPKNELFRELVDRGFAVKNDRGSVPFEDAVLDFSNPAAVSWYQQKIASLLKLGVGAIKVDFGENAPISGRYQSGESGLFEHNLYPLRYNKAVAEVTAATTGAPIIWARSAWAGSQRYPLHWGGDAENTNSAMAAQLRGGLSLGLGGFSFWSHDVGGFVEKAPRDLYRRWLAFGAFSSHVRAHGAPPREPWEYDEQLTADFRRTLDLRYSLLPYIYSQAQDSANRGYPMIRPLFFEFPGDETSWQIEDEYLFGNDFLVAPLFEDNKNSRRVYLPPGVWTDFQSGRKFDGARWHEIVAGDVPIVVLVRDGAVIPLVKPALHTGAIDWKNVELRVFSTQSKPLSFPILRPGAKPTQIRLKPVGRTYEVDGAETGGVNWSVTMPK